MGYRIHCNWCGENLYKVDKAVLGVTIERRRANALEAKWAEETKPTMHFCVSPEPDRKAYNRMGLEPDEHAGESCFDKAVSMIEGRELAEPDMGFEWQLVSVDSDPKTDAATQPGRERPGSRGANYKPLEPDLRACVHSSLSSSCWFALPRAGISTFAQVEAMTDDELLAVSGVGHGTVKVLRAAIAERSEQGGSGMPEPMNADEEAWWATWWHHVGSTYVLTGELSGTATQALIDARLVWLDELDRMSDGELRAVRGIGAAAIGDIREALGAYYWRVNPQVSRHLWGKIAERFQRDLTYPYLKSEERIRVELGVVFAEQVLAAERFDLEEPAQIRERIA